MANAFQNPMALAIVPKIPAVLSIVGSYIIIREGSTDIWRRCKRNRRRSSPKQDSKRRRSEISMMLIRTMISLSIADLFFSIPWFVTTWAVPSRISTNEQGQELWGNTGNDATCTLQGVVFQIGFIAEPTFNVLYAVFALMMVAQKSKGNALANRWVEPLMHIVIWVVALAAGIVPAIFDFYHVAGQICWMNHGFPKECYQKGVRAWDDCDSNGPMSAYGNGISLLWACLCAITGGILMYFLYRKVRRLETRVVQRRQSWFMSHREQLALRQSLADQGEDSTPRGRLDYIADENHSQDLGGSIEALEKDDEYESSSDFGHPIDRSADFTPPPLDEEAGKARTIRTASIDSNEVYQKTAKRSDSVAGSEGSGCEFSSNGTKVSELHRGQHSQAVLRQALYYTGVFLMVYFFPVLLYLLSLKPSATPGLAFFASLLLPLRGFLNLLVYSRHRCEMVSAEGRIVAKILRCFGKCYHFVAKVLACEGCSIPSCCRKRQEESTINLRATVGGLREQELEA